jgi:hypothetical protein
MATRDGDPHLSQPCGIGSSSFEQTTSGCLPFSVTPRPPRVGHDVQPQLRTRPFRLFGNGHGMVTIGRRANPSMDAMPLVGAPAR